MTKDVLVSIRSCQRDEENEETIEIINPGLFYRKNGKIYVKYEETIEGIEKKTNSMIKLEENRVEITKKGAVNAHLVFVLGEKIVTGYESPFGMLSMGIDTRRIDICEQENLLSVELEYDMDFNGQYMNHTNVRIHVMPKGDESFRLMQDE